MNHIIPILVTVDIHSYPEVEKEVPAYLEESLRVLNNFSIKATFFFPAVLARKFAADVQMILGNGHEIGCHGLTHGPEEQYNLMDYQRQKATLYEAKNRVEEVTHREVISFRSPVFKINGDTIRALEENGFKLDSSVNPQRLGVFSSDIGNTGWLYSPRQAYHPSFNSPFIKGESSLWEIPQSAFVFPFISNTGIAFGGLFMKLFYRMLYIESRFRKNPIVYMFHPRDIYPKRNRAQYRFNCRHLLPSKQAGFQIRKILYHNKGPKRILRQNVSLLKMMKDSSGIKFITFTEMLDFLKN